MSEGQPKRSNSLTAWLKKPAGTPNGSPNGKKTASEAVPTSSSSSRPQTPYKELSKSPGVYLPSNARPRQSLGQSPLVVELPSPAERSPKRKFQNLDGASDSQLSTKKPKSKDTVKSATKLVVDSTDVPADTAGQATSAVTPSSSAPKAKRKPLGSRVSKRKSKSDDVMLVNDDSENGMKKQKQTKLSFGKAAKSDGKATGKKSAAAAAEKVRASNKATGSSSSKMDIDSRPGPSSRASGSSSRAKASSSKDVSPDRSTSTTGYKQAHLSFLAGATPLEGGISGSKTPLELNLSSATQGGKKPKKIMDDLADEMLPFSKPLPAFKDVPIIEGTPLNPWRKLTAEEVVQLSSVLAFVKGYGKDLLGVPNADAVDLERFEEFIYHPDSHFQPLSDVYTRLFKVIDPDTPVSTMTLHYRISQVLERSQDTNLYTTFSASELTSVPPPVHAKALYFLLQKIMGSYDFRDAMKSTLEMLQEMRTDKWSSTHRKKELKAEITGFEDQIKEMDAKIEATDKLLAAGTGENGKPDEEKTDMENDVSDASSTRGGTALRRLVDRDKQERSKKQYSALRTEQAKLARERNSFVNKLRKAEKELERLEESDQTWNDRYKALERMVRGNEGTLVGTDRFGRLYWWISVRKGSLPEYNKADDNKKDEKEEEATKANGNSQNHDAASGEGTEKKTDPAEDAQRPIYGLFVEEWSYAYHDADALPTPPSAPDRKGKGKAPAYLDDLDKEYYTPPDNAAKRNMRVTRKSKWFYVDSINTLVKLYKTCNDRGVRERELRNGIKAVLESIGVQLLEGGVKGNRQVVEAAFKDFTMWVNERGVHIPGVGDGMGGYISQAIEEVVTRVKDLGTGIGVAGYEEEVQKVREAVYAAEETKVDGFRQLVEKWTGMEQIKAENLEHARTKRRSLEKVQTFSGLAAWCIDFISSLQGSQKMDIDIDEDRQREDEKRARKTRQTKEVKMSKELKSLQFSAFPGESSSESEDNSSVHRTRSGRRVLSSIQTNDFSECEFENILRAAEGQKPLVGKQKKMDGEGERVMTTRSGRVSKKPGDYAVLKTGENELRSGDADRKTRNRRNILDDESDDNDSHQEVAKGKKRSKAAVIDDTDSEEDVKEEPAHKSRRISKSMEREVKPSESDFDVKEEEETEANGSDEEEEDSSDDYGEEEEQPTRRSTRIRESWPQAPARLSRRRGSNVVTESEEEEDDDE